MEIALLLDVRVRLSKSKAIGLAAHSELAGPWWALKQQCCSSRKPLKTENSTSTASEKSYFSFMNRDSTEATSLK